MDKLSPIILASLLLVCQASHAQGASPQFQPFYQVGFADPLRMYTGSVLLGASRWDAYFKALRAQPRVVYQSRKAAWLKDTTSFPESFEFVFAARTLKQDDEAALVIERAYWSAYRKGGVPRDTKKRMEILYSFVAATCREVSKKKPGEWMMYTTLGQLNEMSGEMDKRWFALGLLASHHSFEFGRTRRLGEQYLKRFGPDARVHAILQRAYSDGVGGYYNMDGTPKPIPAEEKHKPTEAAKHLQAALRLAPDWPYLLYLQGSVERDKRKAEAFMREYLLREKHVARFRWEDIQRRYPNALKPAKP